MKRNVLVIAGLAVLSTNAFASKARVQALGQDANRGSEYIADSRNVFRNPAALNETKNYLVTEWGTAVNSDGNAAPRAEGGFFREMGAFNYGLYLGNDGENNGTRTGAANAFLPQDNAIDLFLAGDMGVKWGARLHYAGSKDESLPAATPINRKNTAYGIGLGVVAGAIEGYANVDISDKSEGAAAAGDEWKLKPSYLVGGSFTWTDYTFFASYENTKAEQKLAAVNTTLKTSEIVAGVGRTMEINPTARVFGDAKVSIASDTNVSNAPGKTKVNTLPITIGMEADATSWLTLRGSVSQNVFLNETKLPNGKKRTNANQTFVNAGATLNFGKLKVDGLIGTSDASRAGTVAAANGTNQGVLTTDNLLTRVAVSYWF